MKTMRKTDWSRARTTLSICGLALMLTLAVGACGQRGPLYLPDSAPSGGKAANEAAEQDESSRETQDQEKDSENEKTP
jgi:predicted small lipoprotein YifL